MQSRGTHGGEFERTVLFVNNIAHGSDCGHARRCSWDNTAFVLLSCERRWVCSCSVSRVSLFCTGYSLNVHELNQGFILAENGVVLT